MDGILAMELTGPVKSAALIVMPLLGGVLLAYGAYNAVFDLRISTRRKVVNRLHGGSGRPHQQEEQVTLDFRKTRTEAKGFLAKRLAGLSFTTSLQRTLEQANVHWSAPQTLVNLTAASSMLLAVLLTVKVPLLFSVGSAAAVFVLPILYLYRRRKSRMKRLVNQLPDVFELLSQALRAGHSLASGMQLVARELPDPAGTEFGRVFHEQNLGMKVEDALRNLADRVDILDVRFFVTAVLIQRQVGGDLAEVLDKIGRVIRDRIELFGAVQALTAEGRLSGYVLLALPVVVFLVMLRINANYAYMLFTDPTGKMMLTGAIVMQLMGWAMIKKIVNIKV
jgi:tight adherence protein B